MQRFLTLTLLIASVATTMHGMDDPANDNSAGPHSSQKNAVFLKVVGQRCHERLHVTRHLKLEKLHNAKPEDIFIVGPVEDGVAAYDHLSPEQKLEYKASLLSTLDAVVPGNQGKITIALQKLKPLPLCQPKKIQSVAEGRADCMLYEHLQELKAQDKADVDNEEKHNQAEPKKLGFYIIKPKRTWRERLLDPATLGVGITGALLGYLVAQNGTSE